MSAESVRRRKRPRKYEILVMSTEEGGKTRRFQTGPVKLWFVLGGTVVFILATFLALLLFTPLGLYLPIPNPELEQKYGREIASTQERLNALAEDVLVLREYNRRLRVALGETEAKETSRARVSLPPVVQKEAPQVLPDSLPGVAADLEGDFDLAAVQYNAVITSGESFRGAFPLLVPTDGVVSQGFDPSRNHFGTDFAAKRGTPVHAATDGMVVFAGWTYEDGNMIMISHGGGYTTVYKHNQSLMKGAQSPVRRGEIIALVGNTGKTSMGHHLHFEVWKDGVPLDPAEFLLTPSITP